MKRIHSIMALAAAGLISACGGTSAPTDTADDAVAGYDTNTVDTGSDLIAGDTAIRDTAGSDLPMEDTTVGDAVTDDVNTVDTLSNDILTTDTTADSLTDTDEPRVYWVRQPVAISDPVVNGSYLMNPVDGMSFAYNAESREFVTEFDWDWDDPTISFVWHLDETTWLHTKKITTGDVFAETTNFCMNENWCQFIGFDQTESKWIVMGPRSPSVMKLDASWAATQAPLADPADPEQPPNGAISYTHLFADGGVWVYGYITGSGFGDTVLFFDLDTMDWTTAVTGRPPIYTNCLTMFENAHRLFSIGGLTTTDGGETSQPYGKVQSFDIDGQETIEFDLPPGLANREGMACAADESTGRIYVFGGAVIADNFDERDNTYHNDLWVWEDGDWTQLLPDGAIGEFRQYGDSWMLKADASLPNFGKYIGRMMLENSDEPRLILVGDVPGSSTQMYTLTLSALGE